MPLGSLQKGSFVISDCMIEIKPHNLQSDNVAGLWMNMSPNLLTPKSADTNTSSLRRNAPEWLLIIGIPSSNQIFTLGVRSKEEANEWSREIQ